MRYALLEAGVVTNVILLADPARYSPPEGTDLVLVDDTPEVGIGWALAGGAWTDPRPAPTEEPPPAPGPVLLQSPNGQWWEQRVNNGGIALWFPVVPAPAPAAAAAPITTKSPRAK